MSKIIEQDCLSSDFGVHFWVPDGRDTRGCHITSFNYKVEEYEDGKKSIHGYIMFNNMEDIIANLNEVRPFDVEVCTYHPPTGDRYTKKFFGVTLTEPNQFICRACTGAWKRHKSIRTLKKERKENEKCTEE